MEMDWAGTARVLTPFSIVSKYPTVQRQTHFIILMAIDEIVIWQMDCNHWHHVDAIKQPCDSPHQDDELGWPL